MTSCGGTVAAKTWAHRGQGNGTRHRRDDCRPGYTHTAPQPLHGRDEDGVEAGNPQQRRRLDRHGRKREAGEDGCRPTHRIRRRAQDRGQGNTQSRDHGANNGDGEPRGNEQRDQGDDDEVGCQTNHRDLEEVVREQWSDGDLCGHSHREQGAEGPRQRRQMQRQDGRDEDKPPRGGERELKPRIK